MSNYLTYTCSIHGYYEGIEPPEFDCKECFMIWQLKGMAIDPRKFITDLAKLAGLRVPVITKKENPLYHGKTK